MFGPLKRLHQRVERFTARRVSAVLSVGLDRLVWPAATGGALGVLVVQAWPDLSGRVHAKYGGAFVVLALALGVLGLTWALSRRLQGSEAFPRTVLALRRWSLPALLFPVAFTASQGLEKGHGFLVVGLAILGAWLVAHGTRAWLERGAEPEQPEASSGRAVIGPLSVSKPFSERWSWLVLGLLVAGHTFLFSRLSINNHLSFNTSRADLGFYVSIFRRSSLGDLLGCTICGGGNHLSGHFDPILVLLSPLYLLYPQAETILVLQAFLLAITMVPLYLLARHHGVTAFASLLLCLCYSLHPALHGVNLFDFHSLALLVPSVVWLLWARDTGRHRTYWALLVVTLLVREDAALVAIVIGFDTLLSRRPGSALRGLTTMVLAAGYFVFVKAVLMGSPDPLTPSGTRGYAYYYKDLVPKNTGTMGLVTSVLSRPHDVLVSIAKEAKVLYWAQLLVPLLLLPLLAPRGRIMLAYGAAFTLLASREHVYSLHFHYSAVVLPFLFYLGALAVGNAEGSARLLSPLIGRGPLPRSKLQALLMVTALAATLLLCWRFGGIFPNKSFRAGFRPLSRTPTASEIQKDRDLKRICEWVPDGAIVASNEPNLPHLGACPGYQVKKKRLKADYLAWSKNRRSPKAMRNPYNRKVREEVDKGYWKHVGSFGSFDLFENVAPAHARRTDKKVTRPKPVKRTRRPTPTPPRGAASRRDEAEPDVLDLDGGFRGGE